ncbi:unnamed protein product [Didymodactylos carnosus]|uniref:NmrA-like domain-containing protein n=1 Tax=Didymodactylos carnosus TaxID=1234261 RepID=A0A814TJ53_9BILA|nr:unnamed protein product [Didymodactylos carnosus]CAF1162422.1 unnamed protein product [Didymodactylos carnosus]CAF3924952.1 unnamed protein product [Didymodactylos carnosus]CAF3925973.1 unnamed protein product [Didymodactylos carnosus]
MSSTPSILVLNATSTVGSKIVAVLNGTNHFNVKAATRSPQSNKAKELRKLNPNVIIVQLVADDDSSIAAALEGVTRLFIITPLSPSDTNFITRILAIGRSFLDLAVYLSAESASQDFAIYHRANEKAVQVSGVSHIILRPTSFMDNTFDSQTPLFRIENNTMTLFMGETKMAHIDTRDVAEVGAKFLTMVTNELKPYLNQVYVMRGSQSVDCKQICHILSQHLLQQIRYLNVSEDDFRSLSIKRGFSPDVIDHFTQLGKYFASGKSADPTPTTEQILGKSARNWNDFMETNKEKFTAVVKPEKS